MYLLVYTGLIQTYIHTYITYTCMHTYIHTHISCTFIPDNGNHCCAIVSRDQLVRGGGKEKRGGQVTCLRQCNLTHMMYVYSIHKINESFFNTYNNRYTTSAYRLGHRPSKCYTIITNLEEGAMGLSCMYENIIYYRNSRGRLLLPLI